MRSSGRGAERVDLDHLDWVEDAPRRRRSGDDRRAAERRASAGKAPAAERRAADRRAGGAPRFGRAARFFFRRGRQYERDRRGARAARRRAAPEGHCAGRAARARRGRAPHADAGHLPAGGVRPGHGLQRLSRRGVLPVREQLLLLRPPGPLGRPGRGDHGGAVSRRLLVVPQGRRAVRLPGAGRPRPRPRARLRHLDQRRPALADRRRPEPAAQRVRQARRRRAHRVAHRQAPSGGP